METMFTVSESCEKMKVKIFVTRSYFGNFSWDMFCGSKKVASSPMFKRRESCMNIVNKLARALKCPVKHIDLESDYEP